MENRRITNTVAESARTHLSGALVEGASGYIEGMEAQGQRELVNSTQLPTDVRDREAFEALGFVFGEPDPKDPLFADVQLPEGWQKQGSDHAMWSYVVDQRGLQRVAVFYKAAFYDRSAHMHLCRVGMDEASAALYDDNKSIPWALFTDEERSAAFEAFDRMRSDIAEYPDIYGKYQARLDALIASASSPTRGDK